MSPSATVQPHILLGPEQTTPVAIVVGDPKRVETVAKLCDKYSEVAYNREYRTINCSYKGQKFLVTSHGVGSAGAAICFEELIKNGVKVMIRAGTAGSLQPSKIKQADVVIVTSGCREDGVTRAYVPQGYSAVADWSIVDIMKKKAAELKIKAVLGSTLTCDLFYDSPIFPNSLEVYAKARTDIVEMEAATLLTICAVNNVKAAAICTIDGCPFQWHEGCYDPHGTSVAKGKENMLRIVLETVAEICQQGNFDNV